MKRNLSSEYLEYLKSPQWAKLRRHAHARANGICQACGVRKSEQVHHKTYARIFQERVEDLEALCRKCHRDQHRKKPRRRVASIREIALRMFPTKADILKARRCDLNPDQRREQRHMRRIARIEQLHRKIARDSRMEPDGIDLG